MQNQGIDPEIFFEKKKNGELSFREHRGYKLAFADFERNNLLKRKDISIAEWWGPDATAENPIEAYRRFVDVYRLYVEEEYNTNGNLIGSYAEQAPRGYRGMAMDLFSQVVACAWVMRYLPPWMTKEEHLPELFSYASSVDAAGNQNLLYAIEVADIRNQYGYHDGTALRILAAKIDKDIQNKGNFSFNWRKILSSYRKSNAFRKKKGLLQYSPPVVPGYKKLGNGYSYQSILAHLIDSAGGADMLEFLVCTFHRGLLPLVHGWSEATIAQKTLKEFCNSGNAMAMYLFGKILEEPDLTVLGKPGVQMKECIKLWTASALAGNAYAMAALAKFHRDQGHIYTAIWWWKKSLQQCFIPEASYNIGVAYALGTPICPVDLTKADPFYAQTVDGIVETAHPELHSDVCSFLLTSGPNNDKQEEYQELANENLRLNEKRLAENPVSHPHSKANHHHFIITDEQCCCALCGRPECVEETSLLACSRCHKVKYCNKICQRSHWLYHKAHCNATKN